MSGSRTSPADPQYRNWTWRVLQFLMQNFFTFWLGYRVRGLERLPPGGALFLINHQSFLDPLFAAAGLHRPVSYLARDNLFRVPVIGSILRATYVMPIRREAAGTESMRLSIERCRQGYYVGLFPEGTRTRDGSIGAFKPGFLAIARRAGVPVIPIGISGAFESYPRNVLFPRPGRIRVVYGEPISVETIDSFSRERQDDLVALIRDRIVACHAEAEAWRLGHELEREASSSPAAAPAEVPSRVALPTPAVNGNGHHGPVSNDTPTAAH
jgi:1-acyl-sn-glycerol-3-phosphate acyltransferase